MAADWVGTAEAADILECTASNLSQFSYRFRHVCVQPVRRGPLFWPRSVIEQAARHRVEHQTSVPVSIETVAGKARRG